MKNNDPIRFWKSYQTTFPEHLLSSKKDILLARLANASTPWAGPLAHLSKRTKFSRTRTNKYHLEWSPISLVLDGPTVWIRCFEDTGIYTYTRIFLTADPFTSAKWTGLNPKASSARILNCMLLNFLYDPDVEELDAGIYFPKPFTGHIEEKHNDRPTGFDYNRVRWNNNGLYRAASWAADYEPRFRIAGGDPVRIGRGERFRAYLRLPLIELFFMDSRLTPEVFIHHLLTPLEDQENEQQPQSGVPVLQTPPQERLEIENLSRPGNVPGRQGQTLPSRPGGFEGQWGQRMGRPGNGQGK